MKYLKTIITDIDTNKEIFNNITSVRTIRAILLENSDKNLEVIRIFKDGSVIRTDKSLYLEHKDRTQPIEKATFSIKTLKELLQISSEKGLLVTLN